MTARVILIEPDGEIRLLTIEEAKAEGISWATWRDFPSPEN